MEPRAPAQVSIGRRIAFYSGYLSMAAGVALLLFAGLSLFEPSTYRPSALWAAFRLALLGCLAAGLGRLLRRVGIRGLAGSLLILDPARAREEIAPWSRAAGGLLDAALSELGAREGGRVRCAGCGAPGEAAARYCSRCGRALGREG